MARAVSIRVKMNVRALNELQVAVADGLERIAIETLALSDPRVPDDPTTSGSGIRQSSGYVVLNGNRKLGGNASKPRGFRGKQNVIAALTGYGSPLAHLHERGTAGRVQDKSGRYTGRIRPAPFLLPGLVGAIGGLGREVGNSIRRKGLSRR